MDYKLILTKDNAEGFEYRFGKFKDGKLNGVGKKVSASIRNSSVFLDYYAMGEFQDDELNGIGELTKDSRYVHVGMFKNGEPIAVDEYIKGLSSREVSAVEFDNSKYSGKEYYSDPMEGYHVIICDKVLVHYISEGPKEEDSPYSYYRFMYLHEGKEVGLSISFLLGNKDNAIFKKTIGLRLPEETSTDQYLLLENVLRKYSWNFRGLIYSKEVKVEEGTQRVTETIYAGKDGVTIYLPKGIEYLGPSIVKGMEYIFVNVYFDGTIDEWNKIKKGKTEMCVIDEPTWYYYHHDSIPTEEFIDWASGAWKVFVHCLDGDIEYK